MSKRKALDDDLRWLFHIQISSNEDETMDKEVKKVLRRGMFILLYIIINIINIGHPLEDIAEFDRF